MDQHQSNFFTVTSNYDSVESFIAAAKKMRTHSEESCRDLFLEKRAAFNAFKESGENARYVIVSDKLDEFHEITRGYGKGQEPEDYLESFSEYIKMNRDKIEALEIICTRPADLTLKDLRNVSMTLDTNGFNSMQLNTAITQLTQEEGAADIITLIRRYAIGSPLVSHEERIRNAVKKLCKAHNFTASEKRWIDRIEKYLINESVLNVQTFDEFSAWRTQGGFSKINKVFSGKLTEIVRELNMYLYDDKAA